MEFWDTAGQEKFKNIAPNYFRDASAVILIYDITKIDSFNDIVYWNKELYNYASENCMKYLVGNKIDDEENIKI